LLPLFPFTMHLMHSLPSVYDLYNRTVRCRQSVALLHPCVMDSSLLQHVPTLTLKLWRATVTTLRPSFTFLSPRNYSSLHRNKLPWWRIRAGVSTVAWS
jgi:hypothetical protein